ncbi:cytochrome P450 [Paenibacillus sp. N1-5-1-14]|uniref:cytochrome P450 family protein n=1 Tax=Paenibacillus radicibacter TaxID=2972488 RepID=UPI002159947B|nr:cytochrome P450 [Paenibacillus radicibacter]MCR8643295.1 cytochrome P450 [Paenibacillus radicibacter]
MTIQALVDFTTTRFKEEAYSIYRELRREEGFHRFTTGDGANAWLVTRYNEALDVMRDKRFIKNPTVILSKEEIVQKIPIFENELITNQMVNLDPPDHTRLRHYIQKDFTPKAIEDLRGMVQEVTDELIADMKNNDEIEFITDFAFQLPIIVIGTLLGVPKEDKEQFRRWTNAILESDNSEDVAEDVGLVFTQLTDYLTELIDDKRSHPSQDLISSLIHTDSEEEPLSLKELLSMIFLLILAGHETTVNLIGNGMLALFQHPDQFEELKQTEQLLPNAIEEMLRYYSPVELTTNRFAAEDMIYKGQELSKGDLVLVSLASANRDESQFENGDQFDIKRSHNPHMAFGFGIHFCVGAPLARLEAEVAFKTLFKEFPDIQLRGAFDDLKWRPTYLMRGLEKLPVFV